MILNPSFEIGAGLPAVVEATTDEPYALTEGMTLRAFVGEVPAQTAVVTQGTFAVVLAVEGPYALADADTLDITVDGVVYNLVLSAGDFDDITEASAAELADVVAVGIGPAIAMSVVEGATSFGSPTQGAAGSIQVAGTAAAALGTTPDLVTGIDYFADLGAATTEELVVFLFNAFVGVEVSALFARPVFSTTQHGDTTLRFDGALATVLGLPLGPEAGLGYPGQALHWEILAGSTGDPWAEFFTLVGLAPLPFESFELGWGEYLTALGINDLSSWGTETFDTGWPLVLFALGAQEAGPLEAFEDWVLPGFIAISFFPSYAAGLTEDFAGWYAFESTIGSSEEAEFITSAGTTDAEKFGDDPGFDLILDPQAVTAAVFLGRWASPSPPAGTYRLRIGGVTATVTTAGVFSRSFLSEQLAIQINANADGVDAFVVDEALRIWRPDLQAFVVQVEVDAGTPSTELVVVNARVATQLTGFWTNVHGLVK